MPRLIHMLNNGQGMIVPEMYMANHQQQQQQQHQQHQQSGVPPTQNNGKY